MINAIEILAALALFILLHETGHFLACRLFGIEVEEFGIGLPPRAMTLFVRRGTLYTLNWLPLGGFVRPRGEGDPSVPGSIESASPWARMGMYLAGPLMNIIIGLLLFFLMFTLYGVPKSGDGVQVSQVLPGSPAEQAGLQPCDVLTAVDGKPLTSLDEMVSYTHTHQGVPIEVTYLRGGAVQTVTITPRAAYPPDEGPLGITISHVMTFEKSSLGKAALLSVSFTGQTSMMVLSIPVHLLSGAVSYDEGRPVGFKGMIDAYSGIKSGNLMSCTPVGMNILYFLSSITLSLAMFNLLPFPALDGGRVMFLLPEILFKRRIPPAYENAVNMLGFLILLIFLLIINIQDFIHPVF